MNFTDDELVRLSKDPHVICPIHPAHWALARASLGASPGIQFKLWSVPGREGFRKWTAVLTTSGGKVCAKGVAFSADGALVAMTSSFANDVRRYTQAQKKKAGK